LDQVLALPVERPQGKRFLHRPKLKGDIEFCDVTFYYPNQKITALKNFSLKIQAGEKVGFLGRIGSGKSTFEKLLLNLYEPQQGSIKIDGTDIRQIDPADLRSNIGHIPQDIYLFYGSVKDNILLGVRNSDEAALLKAAELSGVIDFVRAHPDGFDMQVGEGGSNLSGGQRQSVAVARALVRDPAIYMMDEPTAMMDHASEARLLNRLRSHVEDKTLLLVTHRMPLVRLVSRLVVVDAGRVVADGPRDEVIKALSKSQIRGA
jgi:ATP-binding cassette subfamily C protein LapB